VGLFRQKKLRYSTPALVKEEPFQGSVKRLLHPKKNFKKRLQGFLGAIHFLHSLFSSQSSFNDLRSWVQILGRDFSFLTLWTPEVDSIPPF